MSEETTTDRDRVEAASGQLDEAAHLAELACEALSTVEGLADHWDRIRSLMFAMRDERDRLAEILGHSLA